MKENRRVFQEPEINSAGKSKRTFIVSLSILLFLCLVIIPPVVKKSISAVYHARLKVKKAVVSVIQSEELKGAEYDSNYAVFVSSVRALMISVDMKEGSTITLRISDKETMKAKLGKKLKPVFLQEIIPEKPYNYFVGIADIKNLMNKKVFGLPYGINSNKTFVSKVFEIGNFNNIVVYGCAPSGTPMFTQSGEFIGFIVIVDPISEPPRSDIVWAGKV